MWFIKLLFFGSIGLMFVVISIAFCIQTWAQGEDFFFVNISVGYDTDIKWIVTGAMFLFFVAGTILIKEAFADKKYKKKIRTPDNVTFIGRK